MKKFFLVIFLLLAYVNQSIADDLKDFEIEGLAIGESLLDYATKEEINSIKVEFGYKTDKFNTYRFEKIHDLNQYDKLNVSVKKGDKNFIIVGISGIYYYKNLDECNSLKKEIQSYVKKEFKIDGTDITKFPSSMDKTGKSIIYGIQNYLKPYPSLESININCYDFTKESLMKANLKVSVNTHEFMDFIINN
jgi:hypothetical protein